jgi:hypothetical protein
MKKGCKPGFKFEDGNCVLDLSQFAVFLFDKSPYSDKYTVVGPDKSIFGMSDNADQPNGVNMYIGQLGDKIKTVKKMGKRLKTNEIPIPIATAIMKRYKEDVKTSQKTLIGGN